MFLLRSAVVSRQLHSRSGEQSPNDVLGNDRTVLFPGERIEDRHEVVHPLFENVQWVGVEDGRRRQLDGGSPIIDLEVTRAEILVRVVLMEPEHELSIAVDPLDLVEIIRSFRGKVKRHVYFDCLGRIGCSKKS